MRQIAGAHIGIDGRPESGAGEVASWTEEKRSGLLQPVDDEEIGQQARVTVGIRLRVRRQKDVRDSFDAGRVGGKKVFPRLPAAGRDLDPRDARGDVAALPQIEESVIG
jgi:hypothetical protein